MQLRMVVAGSLTTRVLLDLSRTIFWPGALRQPSFPPTSLSTRPTLNVFCNDMVLGLAGGNSMSSKGCLPGGAVMVAHPLRLVPCGPRVPPGDTIPPPPAAPVPARLPPAPPELFMLLFRARAGLPPLTPVPAEPGSAAPSVPLPAPWLTVARRVASTFSSRVWT